MKKTNAYFQCYDYKLHVNVAIEHENKITREKNVSKVEAEGEKEIFMLSPLGCDQYLITDSYH